MLLLVSRNPNWCVPKLWWNSCFWIQWTCSQIFSDHFYFLQKNMCVLAGLNWMILQARVLCSFICGICAHEVTCQECDPPSVSKYSSITKAGTTWLFHIAQAKIQQKKNLLKIQGKLSRSSWTLGYLVEFSSPLKSLNQNAQSIRILRTNLSLSTWDLIFHLSFLWIYWKVIIPSVLSV